jgi:hypothetical protein
VGGDVKTHRKGKEVKMDVLSREHYKAVRMEIEGRFFSQQEAEELRLAIEQRTITDPQMRAVAASTWENVKSR